MELIACERAEGSRLRRSIGSCLLPPRADEKRFGVSLRARCSGSGPRVAEPELPPVSYVALDREFWLGAAGTVLLLPRARTQRVPVHLGLICATKSQCALDLAVGRSGPVGRHSWPKDCAGYNLLILVGCQGKDCKVTAT